MKDPTPDIQQAFPSVWRVEFAHAPDGIRVEVHANPVGELCDVMLSRLLASLYPAMAYIFSVIYHWSDRLRAATLVEEAYQEWLK